MTDRVTHSILHLKVPVDLGGGTGPLPAGDYRLTVEEELLEGLSFAAFHRIAVTVEVPVIGNTSASRQYISVDGAQLDAALEAGLIVQSPD